MYTSSTLQSSCYHTRNKASADNQFNISLNIQVCIRNSLGDTEKNQCGVLRFDRNQEERGETGSRSVLSYDGLGDVSRTRWSLD